MPTYEYQCDGCGRRFEKFQGINDLPEKTCPRCGGPARRLISAGGGVLMKGRAAAAMQERCGHEGPCCGADAVCSSPHCLD
jgi:putative FmdB family regulatory protein